jgi:putative nucleotidyltransferase with HDIG domain
MVEQMLKDNLAGGTLGDANPNAHLPEVRFPLRVKITLPFLILSVVLAIGAAYVITQIVFDTIDERFTNQLIEGGKLASEGMVRQEESLLRSLRLYSYAEGLGQSVSAGDIETLQRLSYGIAANQGDEVVEFLDRDGELLLSLIHRRGGDAAEYDLATSSEFAYSELPFVRSVLDGQVDELGDKYSGLAHFALNDVFYVSGPIYDPQGQFVGVVIVGKSLQTLLGEIHDETLAQLTIYDHQGSPVASTLFDPPQLEKNMVLDVLANKQDSSLLRNLGLQRDLNISNIDYDEILGAWEGRGDEDLGVVGISLPRTFLVRTSSATRIQITVLVFLTILLVVILGVYIANLITRPLRALLGASARVADGDLLVQIEPQGNDEVTALTRSFNSMVSSLYQSKLDLVNAYDRTLEGWSMALELRDQETEGHTRRVAEMTVMLAKEVGYKDEDLVNIRRGALLHDIGKMGIPDRILLKPGELSPQEWAIMRQHPQMAYDMLSQIEYLRPALDIPYNHHEWWNGDGYPRGLKGEQIPLPARIFAVVDVWDAMSSDRPYRKALDEKEVWQYIVSNKGQHFDPEVVDIFFELVISRQGGGSSRGE